MIVRDNGTEIVIMSDSVSTREATELDLKQIELQKELRAKKNQIMSSKAYLKTTDYIAAKFSDAIALGKDLTDLRKEYMTELKMRESKRTEINTLEAECSKIVLQIEEIKKTRNSSK